jgi:hypothetical protein
MSGTALDNFNDFMDATEAAVLTGPGAVLNEAVKNSYLLREYLRGREYTEVVQGGSKITDFVMFDEEATYDHVLPGQTHVWKNPQVLDNHETPWRFGIDHMSWTDQEIELQMGEGMTTTARHRVLKSVKKTKERRVTTSIINGLEDELSALPSQEQMEASGGKLPLSIPALINENTDGVHPNWSGNNKQNINAATEARWRPQRVGYNYSDETAAVGGNLIIEAFDEMYYLVGYDELPGYEGQSEAPSNATMIVCSRLGINKYKQAMRAAQDTYVTPSRQDPAYNRPLYSGIALTYASNFDNAAVYPDGGSGVATEASATNNGPRYYWINRKYHKPVFHTKRYMHRHKVRTHPNQPSTHIQVVDCWHNYPAQSLQRHGIVYPSA